VRGGGIRGRDKVAPVVTEKKKDRGKCSFFGGGVFHGRPKRGWEDALGEGRIEGLKAFGGGGGEEKKKTSRSGTHVDNLVEWKKKPRIFHKRPAQKARWRL